MAELDINPLLADEAGVLALDARIRLVEGAAGAAGDPPLPAELVADAPRSAARRLTMRPIRPEDAPGLADLVARTDAEDVRLRFRAGLTRLPEAWAARLSQIDYDREMALAAVDRAATCWAWAAGRRSRRARPPSSPCWSAPTTSAAGSAAP